MDLLEFIQAQKYNFQTKCLYSIEIPGSKHLDNLEIIEDQFSPNLINGDPCLRILQLGNMKISTTTTIKEYVVFVNET